MVKTIWEYTYKKEKNVYAMSRPTWKTSKFKIKERIRRCWLIL